MHYRYLVNNYLALSRDIKMAEIMIRCFDFHPFPRPSYTVVTSLNTKFPSTTIFWKTLIVLIERFLNMFYLSTLKRKARFKTIMKRNVAYFYSSLYSPWLVSRNIEEEEVFLLHYNSEILDNIYDTVPCGLSMLSVTYMTCDTLVKRSLSPILLNY